MGIEVDDKAKEWRTINASYERDDGEGDVADVDVAAVSALLNQRVKAKLLRDYAEVDDPPSRHTPPTAHETRPEPVGVSAGPPTLVVRCGASRR